MLFRGAYSFKCLLSVKISFSLFEFWKVYASLNKTVKSLTCLNNKKAKVSLKVRILYLYTLKVRIMEWLKKMAILQHDLEIAGTTY